MQEVQLELSRVVGEGLLPPAGGTTVHVLSTWILLKPGHPNVTSSMVGGVAAGILNDGFVLFPKLFFLFQGMDCWPNHSTQAQCIKLSLHPLLLRGAQPLCKEAQKV